VDIAATVKTKKRKKETEKLQILKSLYYFFGGME
jgi:hypothetical protein